MGQKKVKQQTSRIIVIRRNVWAKRTAAECGLQDKEVRKLKCEQLFACFSAKYVRFRVRFALRVPFRLPNNDAINLNKNVK